MAAHSDFAHSVHSRATRALSCATAMPHLRSMARTARIAHSQSRLLKFIRTACGQAPESTRNASTTVLQHLQEPEIHEAA